MRMCYGVEIGNEGGDLGMRIYVDSLCMVKIGVKF